MFHEIETAITSLGMTVCDSLTIPGRRTSRAKLPDAFVTGRAGDIPAKLFPEQDGRLYKHQSRALGHLCAGRNVVVSTGTASGKSLIFQLHAMRRLLEDKNTRVLALYPQVALRTDQLNKWLEIVKLAGNRNLRQKDVVMIPSDMSRKDRETAMRLDPRILLMTPDMLHAWFMQLIDQEPHQRFLNGLSLLVLDEAHVYESMFGSNVGFLIRRLTAAKRMAASRAKDAGKIQVVAATATIADPAEHMKRLTGLDGFRVVDEKLDGAPQKEKRVLHVEGSDRRARSEDDVARTLAEICSVEKKTKFIAFIDSRQGAERIARRTNEILGEVLGEGAVKAYRSGLEDKDRREIEKALSDGTLKGVVSTSALELGIDLPDVNIGLNLGVPRTRKSFRQRLGRIGRDTPGMFVIIAPRIAFAQIGDTLEDYYDGSVEPSHLYLGNRFIQFAHARCLRLEVERLGGRNPRKPPAGVKWPEGFANALRLAREGWSSEYDEVARIGGGSPHINYGLRQIGEVSYDLELKLPRGITKVGSPIPLQSAIREAYPGADGFMHNGNAYWIDSWRSGAIAIRHNRSKRPPTRRPDLRKTVEADVSREGVIEGRLKRGEAGFIAEAAIRVKESVEGYLIGGERHSYIELHVNDPNMERKERVFSTTGVIIEIDADWFRDARSKIADGIQEMLSRNRSLAPQDVDCAHSRISVKTDTETSAVAHAIVIYDAVYGGFRLTENLFDDFARYMDKLVLGADKSGEDALLSRELAVRLRDWAKTLVADSSGAGVESVNANIPEGWLQAYKPGTIAEIPHYGAHAEVELTEPILADPFGTGVPQLYYKCRMNVGAKETLPTPKESAVVAPVGNEWEWTLWNPETGEHREVDA